jgi:hypothetical protein
VSQHAAVTASLHQHLPRLPTCADATFTELISGRTDSLCAPGADCSDVALVANGNLTTVACICAAGSYPAATALFAPLAPYREGCDAPIGGAVLLFSQPEVLVELHKVAEGAEERLLNVSAVLNGSHWPQEELRWRAHSEPPQPWLRLPLPESFIPSGASSVPLLVEVTAAGLRDRSDHSTVLVVDLDLEDGVHQQLRIPIRVSVRATAVAANCNLTDAPLAASGLAARAELGGLLSFRVTSRDVDGLPLDHGGAAFTAQIQRAGEPAEAGTTTVTYVGNGVYELGVLMRSLGAASVVVSLVDAADGVASELQHVVNATTVCPPLLEPNGTTGTCGCAAGSMPAAGDVACVPCPRGRWKAHVGNGECNACPAHATTFELGSREPADCACLPSFYSDANGTCIACPPGTSCDASGTSVATLPLLPGFWRAVDTTDVVHRCPLGPTVCVNNGSAMACAPGSTGAFCAACAPNYVRATSGGCELCGGSIALSVSAACCVLLAVVVAMGCALRRIVVKDLDRAAQNLGLAQNRPISPGRDELPPSLLQRAARMGMRWEEINEDGRSVAKASKLVTRGQALVKLKVCARRSGR